MKPERSAQIDFFAHPNTLSGTSATTQAGEGVDLDFLVGKRGAFVPRDNHQPLTLILLN